MRPHPLRVAAGLCAAAAALAPAARAQSPDRVAALQRPAVVAAYGRVIAWSDWSPADDRYHLLVRHDNRTDPAPVPPRTVPFDVDAGPGPGGTVVLAYSRCATEPPQLSPTRWARGSARPSSSRTTRSA